jgi:hypothetical protein
VVESDPGNEDALIDQVALMLGKRDYGQALKSLDRGHGLFPQKGRTAATLAWLLAASPQQELRDGTRGLELAKRVYQATGLVNHGAIVAMALAELGRCEEAAELQRRLIETAEREKNSRMVDKLRPDLRHYETARPCRPSGKAPNASQQ